MRERIAQLKLSIHKRLVRLFWLCEDYLDNAGHRRRNEPIFFAALPVWAVSLIIAGISFGANMTISYFLRPKPKQQVKGKLTGDITMTDSIYGAPIIRVYGGRPADQSPGGVEVGCNIMWMSEIRKIETPDPGNGGGGGGKGGPKPAANIRVNYKVDIAGLIGMGPLRLLRMKWNEDTVYSVLADPNNIDEIRYEAESATLTGTAASEGDGSCSGAGKVVLGFNGAVEFDLTSLFAAPLIPIEPGDDRIPYLRLKIGYKSEGDTSANITIGDGFAAPYTFNGAGSDVGVKSILLPVDDLNDVFTANISGTLGAPDIDYLDAGIAYFGNF